MTMKLFYLGFQKLIVYTVLTVMAIQLIYFNTSYGYAHLILYLLCIVLLDVYKSEFRNIKKEVITTLLYIITPLLLISSSVIGGISGYFYYSLLVILSIINIKFAINFKRLYVNKEIEKINDRNIKMFERNGKFLIIFSYLVILILLSIIGQAVYSMIML